MDGRSHDALYNKCVRVLMLLEASLFSSSCHPHDPIAELWYVYPIGKMSMMLVQDPTVAAAASLQSNTLSVLGLCCSSACPPSLCVITRGQDRASIHARTLGGLMVPPAASHTCVRARPFAPQSSLKAARDEGGKRPGSPPFLENC
jgi:hypothetical protein